MSKTNSMSLIWSISDEEFLKIINKSKNFRDIGKALGFKHHPGSNSRENIRQRAEKLGVIIERRVLKEKKVIPQQSRPKYPTRYCSCGKKISHDNKSGLCNDCYRKNINDEKIKHWKETGDTGCQAHVTLRNIIRTYIFEKQDKKCAICKMENMWNGKELHFILDHINGDASNNKEENLRLICPNCDSQLSTFKSRNKNSARNKFRQKK